MSASRRVFTSAIATIAVGTWACACIRTMSRCALELTGRLVLQDRSGRLETRVSGRPSHFLDRGDVARDLIDVRQVVPRLHADHQAERLAAALVVQAGALLVGLAQVSPDRQVVLSHRGELLDQLARVAGVVVLPGDP